MTLYADVDLKFWVETGVNGTQMAVDLSLTDFEFQASILIVNETQISCDITQLKVKNVVVNSCAFGTIGTFKLKLGLNVGLAVAASSISKKIDSLQIPETLFGYFELSDLIIAYYDGYIGVGITPTFIAPPLPPVPVDSHPAGTICVKNEAGFVLKWEMKDKYTGVFSDYTEHYPIGKTHCMGILDNFPDIREGEQVKTIINAYWGDTNPAQHLTTYTADANVFTTFTCRGTTLNFHCDDEWDNNAIVEDIANLASLFFQ